MRSAVSSGATLVSTPVLSYTRVDSHHLLASLVSRGVVLAGERAVGVAARMRASGPRGPLLVDPATYEKATTSDLAQGPQQLSLDGMPRWLAVQRSLDVDLVLHPAGLVRWPHRDQLAMAVEHGVACCDLARPSQAAVVLALDSRWLSKSADEVVEIIGDLELPVAIVLEDPYDPLSESSAIRGLLHLVSEVEQLMLLRADLHALGALAHGAAAAAIGTNPSLRHLHPPRNSGRGGARVRDTSPSVLVRSLGRYGRGSWLQQVEDDDGLLGCDLDACCDGRPLQRFGAPDETGILAAEAVLHNVVTVNAMAADLFDAAPSGRRETWVEYCRSSFNANQYLLDRTGIRKLTPPRYLETWAEL